MSSRSKDASSKLHEKHMTILANMLKEEENKICADCHAKGPRWASWNLGVFMCIRCAGIHRNLGVHISRVKSVNLDSWTPEQIESIQKGGNGNAKDIYEANLPANFRRPQDDYAVEQFIRAKYERKQYINKAAQSDKKPARQPIAPKKEMAADKSSKNNKVISVPRPAAAKRSPSPQPMKTSPPANRAKKNLVDFDTPSKQTNPGVDLLTGLSGSTVPDLMDTSAPRQAEKQPSFGLDPGFVSSQQPAPTQPSLLPDPALQATGDVKNSIMSLYSTPQPQYNSYTAQGYPVNAYYYQQQQQAAMRMAAIAHQQQAQVNQVQQQMAKIKINQPQPAVGNPPMQPSHPGFGAGTLNPTLW